jgi:hypothetical protein
MEERPNPIDSVKKFIKTMPVRRYVIKFSIDDLNIVAKTTY